MGWMNRGPPHLIPKLSPNCRAIQLGFFSPSKWPLDSD